MKFEDSSDALDFLEKQNIKPDEQFMFNLTYDDLTSEQRLAIQYLIDEWDYGYDEL